MSHCLCIAGSLLVPIVYIGPGSLQLRCLHQAGGLADNPPLPQQPPRHPCRHQLPTHHLGPTQEAHLEGCWSSVALAVQVSIIQLECTMGMSLGSSLHTNLARFCMLSCSGSSQRSCGLIFVRHVSSRHQHLLMLQCVVTFNAYKLPLPLQTLGRSSTQL